MDREIKRVYFGLPDHLKAEVYWVSREYRTNPLSHEEGGSDVVVEYQTDEVFGYDWIKMPSRYVSAIFFKRRDIGKEDFEEYSTVDQLRAIKEEIKRIYARKWAKLAEYATTPFREVWNSEQYDEIPWEILQKFDQKPSRRSSHSNRYKGNDGLAFAADDGEDFPF